MNEETLDLKGLFNVLRKKLLLILAITFIFMSAAYLVSYFFLTPIYQSSTQILVNQEKVQQQSSSSPTIESDLQLINTYSEIIKSPAILSIVIDELKLNQRASQLTDKVTVESSENSQVITIKVENTSPETAVEIANTISDVFQEEIQRVMKVDNVYILSRAELIDSMKPVKPKMKIMMAIGAVIGLTTGVGITFLRNYLDTTIKTEDDIEKLLDLPVLGVIGSFKTK
ncbi:YveK family protein [Sporosarcina aquimarina]|uniref:Wzz/FepE/Etk N-terminal domain-containing protein n=1 Tax=Sporosarcina aquimarina TaxID=114975 RepID=A0ABU4G125_9BACL|nr:Wzz/FepE/Etk N-terminal domain-containing protein [Sporosarcina aquimarina]MDW0110668.1 Wzz/FepE/Etk N-terminal domain-containing protein [Sporosarcina aquimarina]